MNNTLRPRQNGRHFPDDIFKCIFFIENVWIFIKISLKFVPRDPINNNPSLVKIMAWRRPGDKPLYEPMMVSLLTHICVTRLQWVKTCTSSQTPTDIHLTHLVSRPECSRRTGQYRGSYASPDHQLPWYRPYKINGWFPWEMISNICIIKV